MPQSILIEISNMKKTTLEYKIYIYILLIILSSFPFFILLYLYESRLFTAPLFLCAPLSVNPNVCVPNVYLPLTFRPLINKFHCLTKYSNINFQTEELFQTQKHIEITIIFETTFEIFQFLSHFVNLLIIFCSRNLYSLLCSFSLYFLHFYFFLFLILVFFRYINLSFFPCLYDSFSPLFCFFLYRCFNDSLS